MSVLSTQHCERAKRREAKRSEEKRREEKRREEKRREEKRREEKRREEKRREALVKEERSELQRTSGFPSATHLAHIINLNRLLPVVDGEMINIPSSPEAPRIPNDGVLFVGEAQGMREPIRSGYFVIVKDGDVLGGDHVREGETAVVLLIHSYRVNMMKRPGLIPVLVDESCHG